MHVINVPYDRPSSMINLHRWIKYEDEAKPCRSLVCMYVWSRFVPFMVPYCQFPRLVHAMYAEFGNLEDYYDRWELHQLYW